MNRKFALLFPGQGSQAPGMGRFWYDNFAASKRVYEICSEALGRDLAKLCFESNDAELSLTANTQPAIVCTSIAALEGIRSEVELKADFALGHSVGEYAALIAAGVLALSDGIRAVRLRGQVMQEAVPVGQGGMIAVLGIDEAEALEMCHLAEAESGVAPLAAANFNSPGQIVLSGQKKAIDWLSENFKSESHLSTKNKRVRLIPLNVSAPFHCAMMRPAELKMRAHFETITFANARIPVVQNINAKVETEASNLRENLIGQVSAPVQWQKSMELLNHLGCSEGAELGQGQVVKGLTKKINPDFKVWSVQNLEEWKSLVQFLKGL